MQAYFPSPKFPDSTVKAWASELLPYDLDDGMAAVRTVAQNGTGSRPVQLSDLLAELRSVARYREMPDLTNRNELEGVHGIDERSQSILDAYRKKFA